MLIKLNALFISLLFILSGCAFHNGTFDSGVAITNNQFRVVGTAHGNAYTTHVFGLGGLATDALVHEAKRDLYSKYPLAKGMILNNITVDFKRSFYFFAMTTKVMISADIIDFNPEHFDLPYQGFYTNDSTFFPTEKLPLNRSPKSYLDKNADYIQVGSKVKFMLNTVQTQGIVKEINNYGLKCEYQSTTGLKKIYLQPDYVTVIN